MPIRLEYPKIMQRIYKNVPHLGDVVLTRYAQERAEEERISEKTLEKVLMKPGREDTPGGYGIILRERGSIRLVIITNPNPDKGAKVVKTIDRIGPQTTARRN